MIFRADAGNAVGGVCDVCGKSDRLGLGSCVACARAGSDTLVFLESSDRRADRQVIEAWLVGALDGAVSRSDARDAADGVRPVVGLPTPAAGRAVGTLGLRGVNAVAVTRDHAWRRVPKPLFGLAGLTAGVGLFVGLTGTPALIALGPVFSVLLLAAAIKRIQVPVWLPESASVLGLPPEVEPRVRATLELLAPGPARDTLLDLAKLASSICADAPMPPSEDMVAASSELLRLSCRAVVDLDHLDRNLEILAGDPADPASPAVIDDAIVAATETRDALSGRLDEALASLARAKAASPDASADLLRAAERLAEESIQRNGAWDEVERLAG